MLTVATELPNPPFVLGDDLDDLEGGFEFDMVNEIAKRLGVERVEWVGFPFTKLVAGARCPCDFAVNGVSILPDRQHRVDFSSPTSPPTRGCWSARAPPSPGWPTPASSASASRRPPPARLPGADPQADGAPRPYRSTTAAFMALRAGQVDAVMSDVPIVVDAAAKYPGLAVVGQFKTDEQYGAVLAKGSPNTAALSAVIDQLGSRACSTSCSRSISRAGGHPAARLTRAA